MILVVGDYVEDEAVGGMGVVVLVVGLDGEQVVEVSVTGGEFLRVDAVECGQCLLVGVLGEIGSAYQTRVMFLTVTSDRQNEEK